MAGRSQTVGPNGFMQTLRLYAAQNDGLDAIRSVTVSNQTSSTVCGVYIQQNTTGSPYFIVVPNANVTLPCQPSMVVSFRFFAQAGGVADGAIAIHVDSAPLAASGFVSAGASIAGIWDQSTWDTGVWTP